MKVSPTAMRLRLFLLPLSFLHSIFYFLSAYYSCACAPSLLCLRNQDFTTARFCTRVDNLVLTQIDETLKSTVAVQ